MASEISLIRTSILVSRELSFDPLFEISRVNLESKTPIVSVHINNTIARLASKSSVTVKFWTDIFSPKLAVE